MNHSNRDKKYHIDQYTPNKLKAFSSYEDYLHQRSRYYNQHQKSRRFNNIQDSSQHYKIRQHQPSSQIKYYPFQKKVIEYVDRQTKQIVPKKTKIIQYRQRKEVQVIPKQVSFTDYFAVQHVTSYIKQIVPQYKIQYVKVPKVIKSQITVPVHKQIIYYPHNSSQNIEQVKSKARTYLQKQGVKIDEQAIYKPLQQKQYNLYSSNQSNHRLSPSKYTLDHSKYRFCSSKYQPIRSYLNDSPSKSFYKPLDQQNIHIKQQKSYIIKQKQQKQLKYIQPKSYIYHTIKNDKNQNTLTVQKDINNHKSIIQQTNTSKQQNHTGYIRNSYQQYLKKLLTQQNLQKYKTASHSPMVKHSILQSQYNSKIIDKFDSKSPKKYWIK